MRTWRVRNQRRDPIIAPHAARHSWFCRFCPTPPPTFPTPTKINLSSSSLTTKTSPTPAYLFSIFEGSDSIHPFIIATCCFFFIVATCCFLIIDIIYNIWDYVLLCVLIHDCLLPHSIFMFVWLLGIL